MVFIYDFIASVSKVCFCVFSVDEVDDPDAPVEPVLSDDPAQINKDFVAMSGEVYQALEDSRWMGMIHPTFKSSENALLASFTS